MRNHRLGVIVAGVSIGAALVIGVLPARADAKREANERAIADLTAAAAADPNDATIALHLGLQLAEAGRHAEAERWLAAVVRLDPTLADAAMSVERQIATEQGGEQPPVAAAFSAGADIVLSDIQTVSTYGPVGGVNGYAIGSHTCNIGNQTLSWVSSGTPGLAMNAYRLFDGRLVQVGQSWVKLSCCAAQANACGLGCTPGAGLGAGCQDVYTSGWNGGQARLGRRSRINAFSGAFMPGAGVSGSAIAGEIQVAQSEMGAAFPNALYFAEGVYACTEDAVAGNSMNNASYRRVTLNGSFQMAVATPSISMGQPAIYAWRAHGLGLNTPDNSVNIQNVQVPGEGRFIAADKVVDNGDGTWRYEYGVFNINSDRSGGSFSIPVPIGASVTGIGFRDVDYHSGEIYDNTDWTSSAAGGAVTWSSPQTFAQNANSNALRWGTMYNFWFTANVAPSSANATLGLFKPGTPTSVGFKVVGPTVTACPADLDGDGAVGASDLAFLLGAWGTGAADLDIDGATGASDLAFLLGAWGACP